MHSGAGEIDFDVHESGGGSFRDGQLRTGILFQGESCGVALHTADEVYKQLTYRYAGREGELKGILMW